MDFSLKTESTVDAKVFVMLALSLLIAGAGIVVIYQFSKR